MYLLGKDVGKEGNMKLILCILICKKCLDYLLIMEAENGACSLRDDCSLLH